MSDPDKAASIRHGGDEEQTSPGPNLKLVYSLIALALGVALGVAALIVLPFYQRR